MPRSLQARLGWGAILSTAAIALLVHLGGLVAGHAFDAPALAGHPVVDGSASLLEVFARDPAGASPDASRAGAYRPLTTLSFALEHRFSRAAWVPHAVNVVLFACLVGVVTALGRRWLRPRVAFASGLLFAVLPVHVHGIAGAPGRAELMASLLCLGAFSLVERRRVRASGLVVAVLLFLAALLCKESAGSFAGLVLWFAVLRMRFFSAEGERWRVLVPGLVLAGAGIALVLGLGLHTDFALAAQRSWTELRGALLSESSVGAHAWVAWSGFVLSLAVYDLWAAWTGRSYGLLFAGVLAGLWAHASCGLEPECSVDVAERLTLWPSIWLVWACGSAYQRFVRYDEKPRLRVALLVVVLALLGARTVEGSLHSDGEQRLRDASRS